MNIYSSGIKYFTMFLLVLSCSSCSWLSGSNQTNQSVHIPSEAMFNISNLENGTEPVTLIVQHEANAKQFLAMTYDNISNIALDKNVNRHILTPNQGKYSISLPDSKAPIAFYFIYKYPPDEGWKFFVKNPAQKIFYFHVNKYSVHMTTKDLKIGQ